MGLIHGWGRSRRKRYGNPLKYSCLENPIDRGAWRVIVYGVEKNQTRLSDWVLTRQVPYSMEYPERESFHRAGLTLNTGKVPLRFPELFQPSLPSVTRFTSLPIFFLIDIASMWNTTLRDDLKTTPLLVKHLKQNESYLCSLFYCLLQPHWTMIFFPSVIFSVSTGHWLGHWLNWPPPPGKPLVQASPALTYPFELRSAVTSSRKSLLTHSLNLH